MRRIDDGSASLDSQRLARVSAQFEAHRSPTPLPTDASDDKTGREVEAPCEFAPAVRRRSTRRPAACDPLPDARTGLLD